MPICITRLWIANKGGDEPLILSRTLTIPWLRTVFYVDRHHHLPPWITSKPVVRLVEAMVRPGRTLPDLLAMPRDVDDPGGDRGLTHPRVGFSLVRQGPVGVDANHGQVRRARAWDSANARCSRTV